MGIWEIIWKIIKAPQKKKMFPIGKTWGPFIIGKCITNSFLWKPCRKTVFFPSFGGGNLQMVTHKNVLVDELPLKYDAGNHLGVITHKIAAFVSPIEHMFFGFIVIQSFPSFSETTRQKTLGRMLHVVNPGPLSGADNLGPKKILPTERLIAARHQRHEPPFRVTFNFMAKNYWKNLGQPTRTQKNHRHHVRHQFFLSL